MSERRKTTGRTIEDLLLSLMTEAKNIARVQELKLDAEVFEDNLHRYAYQWMTDYWLESNPQVAPTRLVMDEQFPTMGLPTDVEESVDWLVDNLKRRFVTNQLQEMMRQAIKTSAEDPFDSLHQLWKDAERAYETAGSPELPRFDEGRVAHHLTELHSRQEAKRRFDEETAQEAGPTSWEPVNLGPYLRGEIQTPEPSLGVARSDGVRLIYPGREHSVVADTEAGKTWIATACAAAEIEAGNRVVYVHYEETDPASTVEKLRLLGADPDDVEKLLVFAGPTQPVREEYLAELLDPAPTLVVHDGVNEGMSLHGAMTKEVEGVGLFRQRLIAPFLAVNAATLTCDHFPMTHDSGRRDAYGSVHKGNALSGARFSLENVEPFGRGMRGRSNLFVTKDRPGFLRTHGRPTKNHPGIRFFGTLVIDNAEFFGQPRFEFGLHAPSEEDAASPDGQEADGSSDFLANAIYHIVQAQPNHTVESQRMLFACLRQSVGGFTNTDARKALDDLVYSQPPRLIEFEGRKRAKGYQAVVSAS